LKREWEELVMETVSTSNFDDFLTSSFVSTGDGTATTVWGYSEKFESEQKKSSNATKFHLFENIQKVLKTLYFEKI
jgi:hypothetical protein